MEGILTKKGQALKWLLLKIHPEKRTCIQRASVLLYRQRKFVGRGLLLELMVRVLLLSYHLTHRSTIGDQNCCCLCILNNKILRQKNLFSLRYTRTYAADIG